jgi:hypothetical protein
MARELEAFLRPSGANAFLSSRSTPLEPGSGPDAIVPVPRHPFAITGSPGRGQFGIREFDLSSTMQALDSKREARRIGFRASKSGNLR